MTLDAEAVRVPDPLERQHGCIRRIRDSGKAFNAVDHGGVKLVAFLSVGVLRCRQESPHGEHVIWIESQVHAAQIHQRSNHQAGGGEQQHRNRYFADHQGIARQATSAADVGARTLLQRVVQIQAAGLQCGDAAEDHAGQHGDRSCEQQNAKVDGKSRVQSVGNELRKQQDSPVR